MSLFKKKKKEEPVSNRPVKREHPIGASHKVILNSKRLIPIVIQNFLSREVLQLAYMDRWALDVSMAENRLHVFSRSRQKQTLFGEDKGLEYEIKSVKLDNTKRSLLFEVLPSEQPHPESRFSFTVFPSVNSNGETDEDFQNSDSESW
ncbi:MAG: phosphoribosyl-AMP cyclohydrolase [Calditrichia bacterium]